MTVEDLLKAAPAVIAAVVALIRILPAAAQAWQRRRIGGTIDSSAIVCYYSAPLPWSGKLQRRLVGRHDSKRLRYKSIAVVAGLLVVSIAIEVGYFLLAQRLNLSVWWVVVSLIVALVVALALAAVLIRLVRNEDQLTGAVPQRGELVLEGQVLRDVAQQLLAAATKIGMRVISFDGSVLYAAIGVQLAARLFIGEFLKAELRLGEQDSVWIIVESVKLDYVTPSRSRRNVLNLLECFLPAGKEAVDGLSVPEPARTGARDESQAPA